MSSNRFAAARLLFKGAPSTEQPVPLTHRRIFLLPTKFGWIFGLLCLAVLIGAINYGNNLAYALAFLLLSTLAVSVIHTFRTLAGLTILPSRSQDVFAGQPALFHLLIREEAGRSRTAVCLRENGPLSRVDLPAARTTEVTVAAPTEERGRRRLGQLKVSSTYPLGLVQAWSWIRPDMACLVYPQPVQSRNQHLWGNDHHSDDQERGGRNAGSGDFQDLVERRPGDSFKRLDWKAWARGRGLMVKRFTAERSSAIWLDYQAYPDMDSETVLSVLTGLVLSADRDALAYGLKLPGQTIPPSRGPEHRTACLQALALHPESMPAE